jgi:phage regulator Rha-like protein
MSKSELVKFEESVREKIYSVRGYQVMLDRDLAELYGVETKRINEAVKRNKERFPDNFCFQLDYAEYESLILNQESEYSESLISRSQIATSILAKDNSDKIRKGGRTYLPYVFTEQGVSMLSAVLRSSTAIQTSIRIINAFVAMRKFIQANGQIFQRLDRVEVKLLENDQKFEKVFDALESKDRIPDQGIFFEGQVFDAYKFVSDLFRSAEKSIVIIDNYVDDTVLVHLTKIKTVVQVRILTKSISEQFRLDLKKFGEQYFKIEVGTVKSIHDRFIIVDDRVVYHFGASLKDLGRKLFAFTKMDKAGLKLLEKIN